MYDVGISHAGVRCAASTSRWDFIITCTGLVLDAQLFSVRSDYKFIIITDQLCTKLKANPWPPRYPGICLPPLVRWYRPLRRSGRLHRVPNHPI